MLKIAAVTLLELIIVLAIGALLVGLAVPSLRTMLRCQRLQTAKQQVLTALNFARNTAQLQQKDIIVCGGNFSCDGNWQAGFTVFVDSAPLHQLATTDQVLQVFSALPQGVALQWRGWQSNRYIPFLANQMIGASNGRFQLSWQTDPQACLRITVSNTGTTQSRAC